MFIMIILIIIILSFIMLVIKSLMYSFIDL